MDVLNGDAGGGLFQPTLDMRLTTYMPCNVFFLHFKEITKGWNTLMLRIAVSTLRGVLKHLG